MKPVRFKPSPPSRYPRRGRAAVSRFTGVLPGQQGGGGVPWWKRREPEDWRWFYALAVVVGGLVGGTLAWLAVRLAF